MQRTNRQRPTAPAPSARLDAEGWLAGSQRIESPNWDERPAGSVVSLLVIHNISLPPGTFRGDDVLRLFTNCLDPAAHPFYASIVTLRVSSHFFVRRNGALIQFVACNRRAWHAGESLWKGRTRCNDFSIGVELEGTDERAYTARQYVRLARLLRLLRHRYPLHDVAGHSDIAPGRKTDPGPAFDWKRFRTLAGLA